MELIAAHLNTYHLLSSPTLEMVYRISGEREVVLSWEATVTDWVHVYVRTGNMHPQAREVTREGADEIARKPKETIPVAAGRLINALYASIETAFMSAR